MSARRFSRTSGRVFVWLALFTAAAIAAQQRDVRQAPAGTAEIRGVLMSGDTSPQPVRRAIVSLAGGGMPDARSVVTDDDGRFAFGRLPAGTYTLTAKKAAYLPAEFGAHRPARAGSPIALAEAEQRELALTIFRGGVIAGTLRDETGRPVAGVPVAAVNARVLEYPQRLPDPDTVVTNDRGEYRLYGLPPGEYVVAASPTPGGTGEIGGRSAAEMDALLASLSQPAPASTTGVGQPAPLPPARPVSYAPIFYSGTPLFESATPIRVGAGEVRDAASFDVAHVPASTIHGTVSGDVLDLRTVVLAIIPATPRVSNMLGTGGITSTPPDEHGEFTYGNLSPGRYRVVARARRTIDPLLPTGRGGSQVGGMRGGSPPAGTILQPIGEQLFAVADIDVRGQDVGGVSLVLRSGGSMSGAVVFDASRAVVPDDLTSIRVGITQLRGGGISISGTTRVGAALSSLPPVNLNEDGTFVLTGIGPDVFYLRCDLPPSLTSVWKLRSAMADGVDLLDTLITGPDVRLSNVRITLSDRTTELSGSLQSAAGQPVSAYYIVAFSADRAHWRIGARRSLAVRPATDGRFTFTDLPAGEYFMAALTDIDPLDWQAASFLEQVEAAAVKVSVAEGARTVQDLRIR